MTNIKLPENSMFQINNELFYYEDGYGNTYALEGAYVKNISYDYEGSCIEVEEIPWSNGNDAFYTKLEELSKVSPKEFMETIDSILEKKLCQIIEISDGKSMK